MELSIFKVLEWFKTDEKVLKYFFDIGIIKEEILCGNCRYLNQN